MTKQEFEQLQLKEMRVLFPDIKSNSRKGFVEKAYPPRQVEMRGYEDKYPDIDFHKEDALLNEDSNLQKIKNTVPDYFNKALSVETGCECWEDNMIYFFKVQNAITADMQDAIIRFFREEFNQRLNRSMCSPCIKARVDKIKTYFLSKFDIEMG